MDALDSRLKGKFVMVGYQPGKFLFQRKIVDTRSMSVAHARQLIKEGFKYLEEVKSEEKPTKKK